MHMYWGVAAFTVGRWFLLPKLLGLGIKKRDEG